MVWYLRAPLVKSAVSGSLDCSPWSRDVASDVTPLDFYLGVGIHLNAMVYQVKTQNMDRPKKAIQKHVRA